MSAPQPSRPWEKARRQRIKDFIRGQKRACEHCGEDDTIVLDFHHQDPALKSFNVSEAIRRKLSLERIEQEIAKCAVLCSNCHRKLGRA